MSAVTITWCVVGGVVVLALVGAFVCATVIAGYRTLTSFDITPKNVGLEFEPFTMHGARGAEIAGWYLPAEHSRAVVIASHGVADSKNGILPALVPLVRAGYSLVLYDMRHHCASSGRECTLGFWETEDLLRITDHARNTFARSQPLCYWGFSLGAVVSLLAAARNHEVVAVVAQSPFISMREVVAYYLWRFYFLPPWPLVPLALAWLRLRTGVRHEDVDLRIAARTLKHTPVLLLGSPDDPQVPLEWIERLHGFIGPSSQLMVGPYGHYDGTITSDGSACEQADMSRAIEFFNHVTEHRPHATAPTEISR